MKKTLSLILSALMLISCLSALTLNVSAADDVIAWLDDGIVLEVNGTKYDVSAADMTVQYGNHTVKEYAEAAFADAATKLKTKNLIRALLEYGAAAQVYFDRNTDTLANANLGRLTSTPIIPDSYKVTATQGAATAADATLVLDGTIKLVITVTTDSNAAFTVKDSKGADVTTAEIDGTKIVIPVYPQNMDEMYTVSNGDTTITYSAFTYMKNKLSDAELDADFKDLLSTMYDYNQAANAVKGAYVATVTDENGVVTTHADAGTLKSLWVSTKVSSDYSTRATIVKSNYISWDSVFKNTEGALVYEDGDASAKMTAKPIVLDDSWTSIIVRGWIGDGSETTTISEFGYKINGGAYTKVEGARRELKSDDGPVKDAGGECRYAVAIPTGNATETKHIEVFAKLSDNTEVEMLDFWLKGSEDPHSTITLWDDVTTATGTQYVTKDVTIDLNGCTLTVGGAFGVDKEGVDLTIKDSSGNNSGTLVRSNNTTIQFRNLSPNYAANGTVNIYGGTIGGNTALLGGTASNTFNIYGGSFTGAIDAKDSIVNNYWNSILENTPVASWAKLANVTTNIDEKTMYGNIKHVAYDMVDLSVDEDKKGDNKYLGSVSYAADQTATLRGWVAPVAKLSNFTYSIDGGEFKTSDLVDPESVVGDTAVNYGGTKEYAKRFIINLGELSVGSHYVVVCANAEGAGVQDDVIWVLNITVTEATPAPTPAA